MVGRLVERPSTTIIDNDRCISVPVLCAATIIVMLSIVKICTDVDRRVDICSNSDSVRMLDVIRQVEPGEIVLVLIGDIGD